MNDMTAKREQLKKISEVQFAFYECALYLDTHQNDTDGLKKYEMYRKKSSQSLLQSTRKSSDR